MSEEGGAGWNGTVNPDDPAYDGKGGDTRYCKAGKKLLVPLGFERWTSSKGSPMLSVMFGCILDMEKDGKDQGAIVWRNFALTQNAVQFFARFARAMRYSSPFNVFRNEDVETILGNVPCLIGKVEVETGDRSDGKGQWEKSEVKFFDPFEGDWEPDWDEEVTLLEASWDSYLEFRKEHPRGEKRERGGGGGSGGGGGHERGGGGENGDIPF